MASSSRSASASGRPLRGQAREIVYKVATFLRENKSLGLKYNVVNSTSAATGVSCTTVKKILGEGAKASASKGLSFSTPEGKKAPRKKRIEIDDFIRAAIRRKVHEFYAVRKTVPSLKKLVLALKEGDILDCKKEFLRGILRDLGFRWRKCRSKRQILMERSEIAAWRAEYLRAMNNFRMDHRNIVYIDETYVDASVSQGIGKTNRLIIMHGGGDLGFVPNAFLIFKANQKSSDFHDEMNYDTFSKWLREKLIPNLPPRSVVVMDNASYHCVQKNKKPNSSSLEREMTQWLTENEVTFSPEMTKAEMLQLIKQCPIEKKYVVDDILTVHGHDVLRLPPLHSDLNPIENIWDDIKGRLAEKITNSLEETKEEAMKEFEQYSAEKWKSCCDHVQKVEKEYCDRQLAVDVEIDKIIISFGGSSESSDELDSSDEDSDYDSEITESMDTY